MFRHKKSKKLRRIGLCVLLSLLVAANIHAEPIDAELGKNKVWVGEGAPLYITLKAAGPFSGTASFDLPELPGVFFIKQGRPTVGSETVHGESFMTQRHEFWIYSQQAGIVEIPSFEVRFDAQKDFISSPEPHIGQTPTLFLAAKRPPGVEGLAVSVREMTVEQTWSIEPDSELKPGDVIERRITRSAPETTGMIFPVPELAGQDGVRIYTDDPEINDKSVRGGITAERTDIIRCQFLRGGTFDLPPITFTWWNSEKDELESRTVEGLTCRVIAPPSAPEKEPANYMGWIAGGVISLLILPAISGIRNYMTRPERLARKAVIRACRAQDARAAYAALLEFHPAQFKNELLTEWKRLSAILFSENEAPWNGIALQQAFLKEIKIRRKSSGKALSTGLPRLNPG